MEQQKQSNDEIDLGGLFKKIGDGLKSAWVQTIRLLALLRRIPLENKSSFVTIIIVSIALSVAYSILLKKKYFETTMILSSQYFNKRLIDNAIENLDNLAKEKSSRGLARVLNIPDSLAENILGFEARPFISEEELLNLEILKQQFRNSGEKVDADVVERMIALIEIENRHSFEITLRTLSPTVIPNLQGSIVDYFRTNEFVMRRIEINKIHLEAQRLKIIDEMKYLDSLKQAVYSHYLSMADQSRRAGSNNIFLGERAVTNPVEIFNRDMALYDDLQAVERELYLQSYFEIVDGFTEFSEPASPSTAKVALLSLLLGILVAYLDVAVRSLNSYLAKIE